MKILKIYPKATPQASHIMVFLALGKVKHFLLKKEPPDRLHFTQNLSLPDEVLIPGSIPIKC